MHAFIKNSKSIYIKLIGICAYNWSEVVVVYTYVPHPHHPSNHFIVLIGYWKHSIIVLLYQLLFVAYWAHASRMYIMLDSPSLIAAEIEEWRMNHTWAQNYRIDPRTTCSIVVLRPLYMQLQLHLTYRLYRDPYGQESWGLYTPK